VEVEPIQRPRAPEVLDKSLGVDGLIGGHSQ
jgi:hypothetical protein